MAKLKPKLINNDEAIKKVYLIEVAITKKGKHNYVAPTYTEVKEVISFISFALRKHMEKKDQRTFVWPWLGRFKFDHYRVEKLEKKASKYPEGSNIYIRKREEKQKKREEDKILRKRLEAIQNGTLNEN